MYPYRMDPVIKDKWLEALRSGNYAQARSALRRRDTSTQDAFCCLGVLCDVIDPTKWHDRTRRNNWDIKMYEDCASFIPLSIMESVRLSPEAAGHLAVMNDNGHRFLAIADHIEKYL